MQRYLWRFSIVSSPFTLFSSSFWALALWHDQVLEISWHRRKIPCWSSVLLSWWPFLGCLPAWLWWNQSRCWSPCQALEVCKSKTRPFCAAWSKTVWRFSGDLGCGLLPHIQFCSVLHAAIASLCGLGKALQLYCFHILIFILFVHLYHVNETVCPQTLRCVAAFFILSRIDFKSRLF